MVVFEDGKPKKSNYRRYKIETPGPDDYAMMREVLTRRYKKLISAELTRKEDTGEVNGDTAKMEDHALKEHTRPDLIVIDGGKGQLNTALQVLKSLNLTSIPVIGLAKEFEHIFIPGFPTPIHTSPEF